MSILHRKIPRLIVFRNTAALALGLGISGCGPVVPQVAYNGSTFAQRIQPGTIRIHSASQPDEFYKNIGTLEITCRGQAQENDEAGNLTQAGRGGCTLGAAMELARQQAASVGAHGLHSVSTKPAAPGYVVAVNATAFRYISSDHEPGLPSAAQKLAPIAAVTPPAAVAVPANAPEETAPAASEEAETAPPAQSPSAHVTSLRPASATQQPEPIYPPLRLAGQPPRLAPAAVAATPMIPAPPPESTSAKTLLPTLERLNLLKELKDKGMIPAALYERRRKEILQGN